MTQSREIKLNTESQHSRQFPLDPTRLRNCKMKTRQISRIRDMELSELHRQVYVIPEEFAYITGRTLKAVRNLMDRAQIDVYREGMPGSKKPKRFVMLQEYWDAMASRRALITPEEKGWIDRLMRDKATYRRTTGKEHKTLKRNSHATRAA